MVVDEVGDPRKHPAGRDGELLELIDRRVVDNRTTVLLTNLDPAGLWELLGQNTQRRCVDNGGVIAANWGLIRSIVDARQAAIASGGTA